MKRTLFLNPPPLKALTVPPGPDTRPGARSARSSDLGLEEPTPPGWQRALLLRRSLSDPTQVAYYPKNAPVSPLAF
jgi:hypothetical protein